MDQGIQAADLGFFSTLASAGISLALNLSPNPFAAMGENAQGRTLPRTELFPGE